MAEPGPSHLSIGEVLGLLLEEFPDVTISKIRFLESQGLIEPERTSSGYRKFFHDDVELLRLILREQREKFLPLRVIKDRLDSGEIEPDATPSKGAPEPERPGPDVVANHPAAGRPAAMSQPPSPSPSSDGGDSGDSGDESSEPAAEPPSEAEAQVTATPLLPGVLVNRTELCAMASVTPEQLAELEEYGVVSQRSGGGDLYGDDAVEIASAAGGFMRAGLDARHLRAWRTSAEREVGLYEQLVLPVLRQRNPQARAQVAARLQELAGLGARLRAAMMRAALRRYLEM